MPGGSWKSEEITTSAAPEDALIALLSRYRAEILRARASGEVRIVTEIVAEFGSVDELRGVMRVGPVPRCG